MRNLFEPQRKTPKPHQLKAVDMLRQSLASGKRRPVLHLATGAGKTFTSAMIVNMALAKGKRVAFTVPAIALVDQTVEAFEAEGIDDIGVVQADHPRRNAKARVQVCSVQTLARRDRPEVDLVIVDEAHVRSEVIAKWMLDAPAVVFVGLSATPWAKGMAEQWDDLVRPVSMRELIDLGILCPYRVWAPAIPDLSKVRTVAGDYNQGQLADEMGKQKLVADIVSTWLVKGDNRPTLAFCVDRAHAAKVQAEFEAAGVPAGYMDAFTPGVERKLILRRFKRGEIKVLVNIGVLTTGFDADVRCIIMARPTQSEMLYVQMFGRGLRTAEGKDHLIFLDHAGNAVRLGFPDEIDHPALLGKGEPRGERAERKAPLPKPCPQCQFVKPPKVHQCPSCGFQPQARSQIEAEDGELEELRGKAKPKPPTKAEKQLFWSMALHYAHDKGKGESLAHALYRDRFGVWARGLVDRPERPNREWLNWKVAKDIRYRKGQEALRRRNASQGQAA